VPFQSNSNENSDGNCKSDNQFREIEQTHATQK